MRSLSKIQDRTFLGAILAATACLYAPILKAGFVYDDWWYIVQNPAIRTWDIRSFFTHPATVAAPSSGLGQDVYRPMETLFLAIAYHAWGLRPWPYHLLSLGLHLLNGFLLFGVLKKLLRDREAAFFGTLIFLWHAVQVQSVAWASQTSGLVGMAGILLCLRFFLDDHPLSTARTLVGWVTFAVAVFFKETAIVLPLVIGFFWKRDDRRRLRYVAGLTGIALLYMACRQTALHQLSQFSHGSGPWSESISLGLLAFPVYLGKIMCPVALRASYGYPVLAGMWPVGAGVLMLAYIGAVYVLRRREPVVAQALGWILIGLLPVLQIVPIRAFVAERFLYIPMAGAALLAGWGWLRLSHWRPGLAFWALFLAIQTVIAIPAWKDERSLWQNAIRQEPSNAFAHACYAQSLGESPAAEQEYFKVLENRPSEELRYAAYKNLAWMHHQEKHSWKAKYWRRKSEAVKPAD
jgi:hypothetical protein